MVIQPRQPRQNLRVPVFARFKHKLTAAWHHSQIGHRSEYSIERFLALRDYYQRTSIIHAIAVCVLTPLPALLTALLIDCIPLRPRSEGWRGSWIRQFITMFCEAVGVVFQVREVIESGTISHLGAIKIGLGTAISSVLVTILVAALWRFPIPFGYVLLLNVYVVLFMTCMVVTIGPRVLRHSPTLQQQIQSQLFIIANQGIVAVFYPLFSAVFNRLSGIHQTAFVLVMPMIKFFTKQNVANAAASSHEYIGPIVVFSIDLFNVYYVAICMQTSKSIGTTLIIMAADSFHMLLALRGVIYRASVVQTAPTSQGICSSESFFRDFLEAAHKRFLTDESPVSCNRRIRLFSPFPLPLSEESRALMGNLESLPRFRDDKFEKRRCSSYPSQRKLGTGPTGEALARQSSSAVKKNQVVPASPVAAKFKGDSKPNFEEQFIYSTLQTLFHSEYVLVAEYIEFVVPMLYAPYLLAIFHLPVAAFYPNTASMTEQKLHGTVANILLYATIEFAAFVALIVVLRRKIGFSPLYQLAFLLETQAPALQGHLVVWTITILHLTLVHYGTYSLIECI
eukprot:jgi/Phyca11/113911/e_gw1.25.180.1